VLRLDGATEVEQGARPGKLHAGIVGRVAVHECKSEGGIEPDDVLEEGGVAIDILRIEQAGPADQRSRDLRERTDGCRVAAGR
jgi:hypothetical protein